MSRFLAPPSELPIEPGSAPRFSVLVPAYNASTTIAEAVESALGQTTPPHEVVVCDDGSTDDLEGALAPFRDRIVLVRKENGGSASLLIRGRPSSCASALASDALPEAGGPATTTSTAPSNAGRHSGLRQAAPLGLRRGRGARWSRGVIPSAGWPQPAAPNRDTVAAPRKCEE